MKDSDEAVERVFEGLREVEPPAGMERRILAELADATSARGVERACWQWMPVVGIAVGLAAVLMVLSLMPHGHVPARVDGRAQRAILTGQRVGAPVVAQRVVARPVRRGASPRRRAERMVSFPAPPLPLTQQERLLLHVVQRGDAGSVEMLMPARQATQIAQEEKQFTEFFQQKPVEARHELEQR